MSSSNLESEIAESHLAPSTSKERWYGAVLFGGILIGGLILVGVTLWWAYTHVYRGAQGPKVSITSLVASPSASEPETPAAEEKPVTSGTPSTAPEKTSASVPVNAKEETCAVLNGGGKKGIAGEAATLLRQAGYTRVTTGNTQKDYTGITVYYAAGKEAVAAQVVKDLLRQYPKTVSKEAPKTDTEASSATLVVIFGKESS